MNFGHLKPLHVLGGQCVISADPERLLRTVLGSCVSACIYDPLRGIGGMNHFILPHGGGQEVVERQHRYGDIAMRDLIAGLCRRGARAERLLARLYGGRLRKGKGMDPGALNAAMALRFLDDQGIELVDASLGGDVARWVSFHPVSGEVLLKEAPDIPLAALPPSLQARSAAR